MMIWTRRELLWAGRGLIWIRIVLLWAGRGWLWIRRGLPMLQWQVSATKGLERATRWDNRVILSNGP